MVIVCEDSVVTPAYLREIRAEVLPLGQWSDIAIYPIPPDEAATAKNNNPQKSPRKIRALLAGDGGTAATALDIEEQYRAVPVRYVREAQLRILEEGYNEGWAVYDLDGHPAQERAHALSLTEPIIRLGFSSVAIEHWFLLHFVRDNTSYTKSAQVPLDTHIPNYAKDTKGGIDVYRHTRPRLEIALENAGWLRTINAASPVPFYTINPYVDMDRLIKRIYGREEEISWGELGAHLTIRSLHAITERIGTTTRMTIVNFSSISVMSSQIGIYTLDPQRKRVDYALGNKLIPYSDSFYWEADIPSHSLLNLTFENHRVIVAV
jgi:hypothetical protein